MRGERILNFVLLVILIVFYFEARKISPGYMVESVMREVGADFWPKALLLMLLFLTLILNLKAYFNRKKPEAVEKTEAGNGDEDWRTWIYLSILSAFYVALQVFIGFIFAGLLLTTISLILFGYRKKAMIAVVAIVFTVIFTLGFGKFLFVPLPRGIGVFRSFSYLMY